MDPSAWVDCYESATSETIRLTAANLDAPVPSCPGWTGRDLLAHIGRTPIGWLKLMTQRGSEPADLASLRADGDARVPNDPAVLAEWVTAQVQHFTTTLRAIDPNEPVFTGGPSSEGWPSGTAAFWMRRGAVEASIHHWDALSVSGAPQRPIPPLVASDGLDELTGGMIAYWISASPVSPARSLTLAPSDVDRCWVLGGSDTSTAALVSGPAGSILLAMWGRGATQVDGDLDVLGEWAALAAAV